MAKRNYIPITSDVPGVNESQRAFIRKVIRTALAAEGMTLPCEIDVRITNDSGIHDAPAPIPVLASSGLSPAKRQFADLRALPFCA